MIETWMTGDRRLRASRLLSRHLVESSLAEALREDVILIHVLESLVPWRGDSASDVYADVAYLHGHAILRIHAILSAEQALGRLHEALTDSLSGWLDAPISKTERAVLVSALMNLNRCLIEEWGIGSRAIMSILLLLNPDQESLVRGLTGWPKGRYSLGDIAQTCIEAEAIGFDPIHALCWDMSVIGDIEENRRPTWNDLGSGYPSFAEPMLLSGEEIDEHLTDDACKNLRAAIRVAASSSDRDA